MTISDLILAFNKAWKEVNKDKIRSKKQISEIGELVKDWKERIEDMEKIDKIILKHWYYFPIAQRNDYVKKTYDLIHFGIDVEYLDNGERYFEECDISLTKICSNIYITILNYFTHMKNYYHTKDYKMVNSLYETCMERINEKLEEYHMTENQISKL